MHGSRQTSCCVFVFISWLAEKLPSLQLIIKGFQGQFDSWWVFFFFSSLTYLFGRSVYKNESNRITMLDCEVALQHIPVFAYYHHLFIYSQRTSRQELASSFIRNKTQSCDLPNNPTYWRLIIHLTLFFKSYQLVLLGVYPKTPECVFPKSLITSGYYWHDWAAEC